MCKVLKGKQSQAPNFAATKLALIFHTIRTPEYAVAMEPALMEFPLISKNVKKAISFVIVIFLLMLCAIFYIYCSPHQVYSTYIAHFAFRVNAFQFRIFSTLDFRQKKYFHIKIIDNV